MTATPDLAERLKAFRGKRLAGFKAMARSNRSGAAKFRITLTPEEVADIERRVAAGQVTRCPVAAVDETSAEISAADRGLIAAHNAEVEAFNAAANSRHRPQVGVAGRRTARLAREAGR